jgi:transcriptional regulator with XRE-family HTH domain
MSFNEHLKGELEYKGMLVKELAYATGIPKQTIDKYLLANGTMPPADKAVAIAGALGVTVEYLITGKKIPPQRTQNYHLSPEMRSIANYVEPLSREKRKIVKNVVIEVVKLLQQPLKDEPLALSLLQKVFLRLFR